MIQTQLRPATSAIHLIPTAAVARYTAAPAATTVAAAKSLQESIRDVLGSDYETFLQGSYKNDTGIPDLNDVDIVALRKSTTSGVFSGVVPIYLISWEQIFREVQTALEASNHYRGKTELGDKCIKVNTNFKADVIPAVRIGDVATDPIAVYSFREGRERQNFPRNHYANNVSKQARTAGAYKATVRMFKRWARNWFPWTDTAPSFYVECLIHSMPDDNFSPDPAASFLLVGDHIANQLHRYSVIMSVAGDKDILTSAEWEPDKFEAFQAQLTLSVNLVARAFNATSSAHASHYWRQAFNE
jgi:hypothetical protein